MIAPVQGSAGAFGDCREGELSAGVPSSAVRRMPKIHCCPGGTEQRFDIGRLRSTGDAVWVGSEPCSMTDLQNPDAPCIAGFIQVASSEHAHILYLHAHV